MTNTKPELLACPFCGGTAIRARTPSTVIECDSCHAVAFLAAWNRRATAPAEVGDGVPVPVMPGNWPEDASHENGDYECRCVTCEQTFYGHKRRVICKVCATRPAVPDGWIAVGYISQADAAINQRARDESDPSPLLSISQTNGPHMLRVCIAPAPRSDV